FAERGSCRLRDNRSIELVLCFYSRTGMSSAHGGTLLPRRFGGSGVRSGRIGRPTKFDLAAAINKAISEQRLSQVQASAMLRIPQPKISALANYHLDGFSVKRF